MKNRKIIFLSALFSLMSLMVNTQAMKSSRTIKKPDTTYNVYKKPKTTNTQSKITSTTFPASKLKVPSKEYLVHNLVQKKTENNINNKIKNKIPIKKQDNLNAPRDIESTTSTSSRLSTKFDDDIHRNFLINNKNRIKNEDDENITNGKYNLNYSNDSFDSDEWILNLDENKLKPNLSNNLNSNYGSDDDYVRQLKTEIHHLRTQLNELKEENKQQKIEIKNLKKKQEEKDNSQNFNINNEDFDKLYKEKSDLEMKNKEYKKVIKYRQNELKEYQSKISNAENEFDKQFESLSVEINKLKSENEILKKQYADLENKRETLAKNVSNLNKKAGLYVLSENGYSSPVTHLYLKDHTYGFGKLTRLEEEKSDLETKNKEYKEKISKGKKENETLKSKLNNAKNEFDKQFESLSAEINKLKSENENLKKQYADLENERKTLDENVSNLNEKAGLYVLSKNGYSSPVTHLYLKDHTYGFGKLTRLEEEKSDLEMKYKKYQELIKYSQNELKEYQSKLSNAKKDLINKLESLIKDVQGLKNI